MTQIVGRNPTMWQFETLRIDDILNGPHNDIESWKLVSSSGDLVTSVGSETALRPVIRTAAPIFDAGTEVARLEVVRSLRDLLLRSLMVSVFSGIFGILIFAAVRVLPIAC